MSVGVDRTGGWAAGDRRLLLLRGEEVAAVRHLQLLAAVVSPVITSTGFNTCRPAAWCPGPGRLLLTGCCAAVGVCVELAGGYADRGSHESAFGRAWSSLAYALLRKPAFATGACAAGWLAHRAGAHQAVRGPVCTGPGHKRAKQLSVRNTTTCAARTASRSTHSAAKARRDEGQKPPRGAPAECRSLPGPACVYGTM